MVYDVDELIREVRIALDQNMSSEQLMELGDIDTLSLEDIIRSKIESSARVVEQSAPLRFIDIAKSFKDNSVVMNNGKGAISLPKDFMRLISFQMQDWAYSVSAYITEDSSMYAQQHSRYPGIRGCPQKPVVAIVNSAAGLTLEFFSSSTSSISKALYLPYPTISGNKIELCEQLKAAIVYYCAYQTALSVGNEAMAASMLKQSSEIIGEN